MRTSKIIASVFGIGYIRKGGGTVAAACAICIWWLLFKNHTGNIWPLVLTFIISVVGVAVGSRVEREWGKDSYRVVIDEVAGMFIAVLFVPVHWIWLCSGFVLFRFFDIAKPLYIRKMEKLPGGWGVMSDDILAGVYANIFLQVAVYLSAPGFIE